MSGGSWDYLCSRESLPSPETMQQASVRLRELGDIPAADRAEALATTLATAARDFDALRDALHDMEWVDSYDMGQDRFKERAAERNAP